MKTCKICILGIALLSGCTPRVAEWTPKESPKVNRVERTVLTYIFPYPAHGRGMSPLEKGKFIQFLKEKIPSPNAVRITLEEYGGHSDKRLMDIERELLRYGIPLDRMHRNYDHVEEQYTEYHDHKYKSYNKSHCKPGKQDSVVVIIVENFFVITPSCSDFSQNIGNASQGYSRSNFGCSIEVNLGLMVASPQDLLRGRDRGAYDGEVMAASVRRYQTDTIKPISQITTTMQNQGLDPGGALVVPGGGGGAGIGGVIGGGF